MKYLWIFLFLSIGLLQAQNLDKYLWKNRVILLFESNRHKSDYQEQLEVLQLESEELLERDIVTVTPKNGEKPLFLENLGLENDFYGLVLLGKDGGIKLKEEFVVKPQIIFRLIDAMPMRRAEMRKKNRPN
ncbi:DUF4174 domain-containing protein [Muricauda sp. SCSIO 64092]|uniref:DUF4174 domain-containing protein n=1 Tax=Allomuricauda sp. SCSIO 64092 TaxID=2908842 RepID=UPI001FF5900F|nr:DUF4174 domain-containing protein [Muricauda sp. SCSIO 64092]UOY07486.1 DUF4174 domain-containing protein [Muricauda sp. SCSIO 64092]